MSSRSQAVFDEAVLDLTPAERLELAALLLEDLRRPEIRLVEDRDAWSEQDRIDLTAFALQLAAVAYPESEELA